MPELRVLDNSVPAAADGTIPDPVLVMSMSGGAVSYPTPDNLDALASTPDWAKPLVMAALGRS